MYIWTAECGGSRARAYAATGDPLAEDPGCAWQPAGVNRGSDRPGDPGDGKGRSLAQLGG